MDRLPLEGVRVCDFTWVVVGPCVTQMLAVMGAEVIKIETNAHTDITRRNGPHLDGIPGIERSGTFHKVNLSKKSCTLDLTKPRAVEIAKDIIRLSDIVAENFRNGVMERFGLGFGALQILKSDLIIVSTSGMGTTGPNKDYVCYNEEAYAYGGLGYLTGYEGEAPSMITGDYGDYVTATLETCAVLSALHYRSQTGKGQVIDVSMAEAVAAIVPEAIMDYSMNKTVRGRVGNHAEAAAPHDCYPCRGEDKWVAISVSSDEQWTAFRNAIGDPPWTADERFGDQVRRSRNQADLARLVGEWTKRHTPLEVTRILQEAGVPAGPSLTVEEMIDDPQLNQRGFFVAPDHPEVGKRTIQGMPWQFSASQSVFQHAPLLGQDNYYVFCELLGMSDDEFAHLVGEGVIY